MALLGMTTIYTSTESGSWSAICRNSPMIWWPFNTYLRKAEEKPQVVIHQWSGDPSMPRLSSSRFITLVVTHQWSGDPSMIQHMQELELFSRNSPMIWWPFNGFLLLYKQCSPVVTHQWSGDPSILALVWSLIVVCRNSPMIWWPFNYGSELQ